MYYAGMPPVHASLLRLRVVCLSVLLGAGMLTADACGQEAPGFASPASQALPAQEPPPPTAQRAAPSVALPAQADGVPPAPSEPATAAAQAQGEDYDRAIFQKPIPSAQLQFLKQFAGARSGEVVRDKQYRKLLGQLIPACMFHYGSDKPLDDSLDEVLKGSNDPVLIHDDRYFMVSGAMGPYLGGRGFLWIDMQDGIALGGFYFHPTNGEPTPTVTIFSRQVREKAIGMGQLPVAFAEDLSLWAQASRVPPIGTRYFITGLNRRILLEHDEDYCAPADGSPAPPADVCQQMNADAADTDLDTAYYLKQVSYATNATAWMIVGQDQTAWIDVRERTCRVGPDPLGCHIRMTQEHVHGITGRPPMPSRPRPSPRR
jgi:hypothetical protein